MSNEATELDWENHKYGLRAACDGGEYIVRKVGYLWLTDFQPDVGCCRQVSHGTLLDCLHACQEDADKAIQTARGAQ